MKGIERPGNSSEGGSRKAAAAVLFLTAILLPLPAAAHSPSEIVLSHDRTARVLTVRITHGTPLPEEHYIRKVEIKKNGMTISMTTYSSQPDPTTVSYTYPVDADSSSVFDVTATCSISGEKTVKLDMRRIPR